MYPWSCSASSGITPRKSYSFLHYITAAKTWSWDNDALLLILMMRRWWSYQGTLRRRVAITSNHGCELSAALVVTLNAFYDWSRRIVRKYWSRLCAFIKGQVDRQASRCVHTNAALRVAAKGSVCGTSYRCTVLWFAAGGIHQQRDWI